MKSMRCPGCRQALEPRVVTREQVRAVLAARAKSRAQACERERLQALESLRVCVLSYRGFLDTLESAGGGMR